MVLGLWIDQSCDNEIDLTSDCRITRNIFKRPFCRLYLLLSLCEWQLIQFLSRARQMTTTILSSTSFNLLFQSLQNLVFAQIEFFNQSMTKLWKVNMQSTQADFTDLSLSYSFYSHQPYRVLCDKDNVGHISCLKSEKKIPMQRNIFIKGYTGRWSVPFPQIPGRCWGILRCLRLKRLGRKN